MRSGWNTALEQCLRRADPTARQMIEAQIELAADIRQRKSQWQAMDSTTGLELLDDGRVQLADTITTRIENATSNQFHTSNWGWGPPNFQSGTVFAARITWGADDSANMVIDRIVAHLHPKVGAPAKTVDRWLCQPWALLAVNDEFSPTQYLVDLVPLAAPVSVAAGAGTSAADITFNWLKGKPRPKSIVPAFRGTGGAEFDSAATMFVFIWGIQADGSIATNIGWGENSAASVVTTGSRKLRGVYVQRLSGQQPQGSAFATDGPVTLGATLQPVPRMRVETGTYTDDDVTFSGGNLMDLGATPTGDVELVGRGETPIGSTIRYYVRNNADSAWVQFTDGQTVTDVGVSKRQTYKMRAELDTVVGDVTPALTGLGVREITKVDLSDTARIEDDVQWAVDPISGKGETTEAHLVALRDGEHDFRDAISNLLSSYDLGKLSFRLFCGDTSLSRASWLHIDDFLIDDYDPRGASIELTTLSRLALLRGILPPFDTAANSRQALRYANASLKAVYDDLIGTQIAIPASNRGPGVEDTTTLVTKAITESEAKEELDAICFLAGGAALSSQGRVRFVDLFGQEKSIVALFPSSEITPLSVTPGFRQRVPEFYVPCNWDEVAERYVDEVRGFHANALLNLGVARVDPPQTLADTISRWIPSTTLGETIATRHATAFGAGYLQWSFRSNYAYPELEPGDAVAVQTDRFVARDPNAARELRGDLWAIGIVQSVRGALGTEFTVWIRNWADIFGAFEAVDHGLPGLPGDNLVPNGDYERGLENWICDSDPVTPVSIETGANRYKGVRSLKMVQAGEFVRNITQTRIRVRPGQVLSVRYACRWLTLPGGTPKARVAIAFYDDAMVFVSNGAGPEWITETSWTEKEAVVVVPAGVFNISVATHLELNFGQAGTAYFDEGRVLVMQAPQFVTVRGANTILSPVAYGAKGDGTTDDTTAWNACLADALVADGNRIRVPPGNYRISSTQTITKRIIIEGGPGPDSSILNFASLADGSDAIVWDYSGGNLPYGPGMRDIRIAGPGASGSRVGLRLDDAVGAYFENVNVDGFGTGVIHSTGLAFLFEFHHCSIAECGTRLVDIVTAEESPMFVGCDFSRTGAMLASAVRVQGGNNVLFQGCSFDNAQLDIQGGQVTVFAPHFETLVNTTTTPMIVSGGTVALYSPDYLYNAPGASVPTQFLSVSGGVVEVFSPSLFTAFTIANAFSVSGSAGLHVFGKRLVSGFTTFFNNTASGGDQTIHTRQLAGGGQSPTYGTTVNTDAGAGGYCRIVVTDGTAFTIANPTNPFVSQILTYEIVNSSGGAMGAITWGGDFQLAGAFTNPANGLKRTITFAYSPLGKHVELCRAAADI